uniref:acetyl-CoA C-acyltransferase n=1 Tax=Chaetoceros debilis TaxID=122233 RepID=A0A7S3VFY5_9STRA
MSLITKSSQILKQGQSKAAPAIARCLFATQTAATPASQNVVIVDGVRLPFAMASTIYEDEMAVDLQRLAFKGLMDKTAMDRNDIDYVISGTVIQEVKTSNIAREAAINAGLPNSIGGHTVSMACISSSAAICAAADKIRAGHASAVIAGGVETFSDVPIRLTRPMRQKLITLPKAMKRGGAMGAVKHMMGLRLKDAMGLETPAIANYTTGEVMGVSSDRLSAKFGVSRDDQDSFTVRSHTTAAQAHADGFYNGEVVPYKGSIEENGIKGDSTFESVQKLKPAFVKPHGTHTAANSSFLTDGASASLVMSEERALELGLKPLAYLRDYSFKSCDPFDELLLGPTYCSQEVLARNNLDMSEIGVYEIHEAFAGQILSNLTAMDSQKFANEKFNGKRVGKVDMDKLNTKGGSLSLGHPFGATGSRLVTTAARRLQQEQERFALIAACADGGTGHACILERYDN